VKNNVRYFFLLLTITVIFAYGCSYNKGYSEPDISNFYGATPFKKDDLKAEQAVLRKDAGLNEYLRYAALNNPSLRAAFEKWKAALYKIPQVKSLPDPKFSYSYFIRKVETRVGPQRHKFSLSQTFPWISKLELRGDIASEEAKVQKALFEVEKWRLFERVKKAYFEYIYLRQTIKIVNENINLLKDLEQVLRTQYSSGKAPYGAIIRIQTEIGRLEDRLSSLKDLRGPIVAELNAALNRPVNSPLPWPRTVRLKVERFDENIAITWLKNGNPELKAIRKMENRERLKVKLAKKDYFPDITLSTQLIETGGAINKNTPESGKDPISIGFSVNIPLWANKYNAEVREKLASLRAQFKKRIDKENELISQLKLGLYRLRDAERKISLYEKELIPKAKQSFNQNIQDYKAGLGSFTDIIDTERLLLEFELSYERARTDRLKVLSEIERLLGKELMRIEE